MGAVIGALLPLGLVVAISPTILTVLIVLLLGPATGSAIGFSIGYTVGLAADVVVFLMLGGLAGLSLRANWSTTQGWILIVIGLGLVALGGLQFHRRPRAGDPPPAPPGWMSAVQGVSPVRSGLIGTGLGALRPKNLLMVAAASVVMAGGGLTGIETVVVIVLFVALSASTVVGVTAVTVLGEERMRAKLMSWKQWLEFHSSAMMSVVLLIVGVAVFGQGLGAVTG